MKRNGHNLYEIVEKVIRNFFNDDDEKEREEFQRLINEPGLLNNAEELEDKNQLLAKLSEPARFSSENAYYKFYSRIKQRRRERFIKNFRVAASFLFLFSLFGGVYWWSVRSGKQEIVYQQRFIQPISSKAYIVFDDGQQMALGKDIGKIAIDGNTTIIRDSLKVVYSPQDDQEENEEIYHELIVPRGGEYILVLSDGTKIWVNADSRLKYPVAFNGENREVYLLEGEAYFEVTRNETKPFRLHTSRGSVDVLGTAFNVRDYRDEDEVVTTLASGSVQFTDITNPEKQVVLQPGFQVVSSATSWKVHKVNLNEYIGWRDGLYIFNHLTLEKLMKIVERNYNVNIFYVNEECKNLIFSGDLQKYEKVENFLKFIETGGDVRFEVRDQTIFVYKK